jgi:LuxR family maltose regulon positive regulatory protein
MADLTDAKLLLVSAPAGFGKTTLLAEWLAARPSEQRSVAWLSLDQRDNNPLLFWTYAIAALRTAAPGAGDSALTLLQGSRPAPIETVLTALLNDVRTLPGELSLVLDDYHVIDRREIHDAIAFLLEHLPPRLHLVIASRADPELPLARLRAGGQLVEIRAADLRFTAEEAGAYLNGAMGLSLAASDVATLERRTEGWIAALQLAALSVQGRPDIGSFIAGFAGDDRYIVDYLVEEVLDRQPDDVRAFLVQTSVLDRLSGPLCDAVTGQSDGKARLTMLDRANLFLVPLDDSRRWYRYHHLFADVLQAYLLDERPHEVALLHSRASIWYGENGEPALAIRHALLAGDVERAADLVEVAIPALTQARQEETIRGWIESIPAHVVASRPVLAIGFVGGLMASNEFERAGQLLADVEQSLAAGGADPATGRLPPGMRAGDPKALARLPSAIELYHAGLSLVRGDVGATIEHAQLTLGLAADDDHLVRAAAAALSALAFWSMGNLDEAHRGYSLSLDGLARAGHLSDVLGCSIALTDICLTQGRLTDAQRTCEAGLRLNPDGGPVLRGTADMHVVLSQIACERGDLTTARLHLQRVQELGEHTGLPQNPYRWRVATARVREAEGDLGGALELLEDAERVYVGDFSPNVRPLPAMRARVLAAQCRPAEALAWGRDQQLSVTDELTYFREFDHVTLARVLLAQSRAGRSERPTLELVDFLERLLAAAEAGARTGTVIEILVLQALTHQARGEMTTAHASIERALQLAEDEGYVRVFGGEGAPVTALLREVPPEHPTAAYARRLLDVSAGPEAKARDSAAVPLIEPLSERELDVLRLLGSDLSGPDIARELSVSLNTVRTHTKNIYTKLGVNSRRAATSRAADLDLLPRRVSPRPPAPSPR